MSAYSTALTERIGVHEVGQLFAKELGWYFREQPVSDFGIDAEVEIADRDGKPTGKLIALQIKSGVSFFRHKSQGFYTFYGENKHLEYWTQHSLPVFLVIHNPETNETLYQRIEIHRIKKTTSGWSIKIPEANVLGRNAKETIAFGVGADRESIKRYRFSSDKDKIIKYQNKDVYFVFDFWVNKTLSLRNINVYSDSYEKDSPDEIIPVWGTSSSPYFFMNKFFPWLEYHYECLIDYEEQSYEIETHILSVRVNNAAEIFLQLESFYENPIDPPEPEPPSVGDRSVFGDEEDEFDKEGFLRALGNDNS